MKDAKRQILYWTPRVLGILFAAFISIFALDVFSENYGLGQTFLALLIHLIPTALVLLVLAIAWRREWVGGLGFIALGVGYLWMTRGNFHWSTYAVISGSLFLVGALFLFNWFYRTKIGVRT